MANIKAIDLKYDILDRLDNAVIGAQIPDVMRKKLQSDLRIQRAISMAYLEFARDADVKALSGLTEVTSPVADATVGTNGVTDNLKTFSWPAAAFQERNDGGIVNVILDEYEYALNEATPLSSVRQQAASTFYGDKQRVFAFDLERKRLYAPSGLTVKTRIVKTPAEITAIEAATELLVDSSYTETLSGLALRELLRVGMAAAPNAAEEQAEGER